MKKTKVWAIGLSLVLAMSTLSSCVNKTATKKDEPKKLKILSQTFGEVPSENSLTLNKLQEMTNTKLEINWVPSDNIKEKINLAIVSNDMPNILLVTDVKLSSFLGAVQQNMFWDITEKYKTYPNLATADSTLMYNATTNQKNYFIPRTRETARAGIVYREDWAKALNIPVPQNLDDLYEMFKAFAKNDPDKNGKDDTYGFILDKNAEMNLFSVVNGGSLGYGVDPDGNIHPAFEEKEYVDALKFVKRLYDEKIMNQDFSILVDMKGFFKKGTTGSWYGTLDDIGGNWNDLKQNVPTATLETFSKMNGPKGIRIPSWGGGFYGGYAFPKSSNKTEADLNTCLNFFDKISSQEGQNLLAIGLEGTHYKVENNIAVFTDEQAKAKNNDLQSLNQLSVQFGFKSMPTNREIRNVIEKKFAENKPYLVSNPCEPFISETYSKKGAELDQLMYDARVKFIMGEFNEEQYMKEVKKWYDRGGKAICEEFSKQYKNANK